MAIPEEHEALFVDTAQRGTALYEQFKATLEPEHSGKAVAIHVDTGDYVVADSCALARRAMREQQPEGMLFSTTIGPPTAADQALEYRILAGQGVEPYASYFAAEKKSRQIADSEGVIEPPS